MIKSKNINVVVRNNIIYYIMIIFYINLVFFFDIYINIYLIIYRITIIILLIIFYSYVKKSDKIFKQYSTKIFMKNIISFDECSFHLFFKKFITYYYCYIDIPIWENIYLKYYPKKELSENITDLKRIINKNLYIVLCTSLEILLIIILLVFLMLNEYNILKIHILNIIIYKIILMLFSLHILFSDAYRMIKWFKFIKKYD